MVVTFSFISCQVLGVPLSDSTFTFLNQVDNNEGVCDVRNRVHQQSPVAEYFNGFQKNVTDGPCQIVRLVPVIFSIALISLTWVKLRLHIFMLQVNIININIFLHPRHCGPQQLLHAELPHKDSHQQTGPYYPESLPEKSFDTLLVVFYFKNSVAVAVAVFCFYNSPSSFVFKIL